MKLGKQLLLLIITGLLFINTTWAAQGFIVKRIQIVGLQGLTVSTVRNYLPIHEGQRYTPSLGQKTIRSLYKTGFFSNIRLARKGQTLIVHVKEYPTISLINFTGNKELSNKKLKPVLKNLGIEPGTIFSPNKLNTLKQGMLVEYGKLGYHAVMISTQVKPLSRNRVAIYVRVNEGKIAKVHSIHIIGNNAFSEHELLGQMKLTTPGIMTWFTHDDRYSKAKLQADLMRLQTFYFNHGYIQFRVLSYDAKLTRNLSGVDIVIHVSEGPQYRVGGYRISGQTFGLDQQLVQLVQFKKGDVFSRQIMVQSNNAIGNFLADRGYAFARVNVGSRLDTTKHLIYLNFVVVPGQRIYVRRINFFGNSTTDERVFRRELRQMEGAAYSLAKIKESTRRIGLLPYVQGSVTQVATQRVTGHKDEVDLNYHVKEIQAGKASVNAGYSDAYGFLYGASIYDPNFLGSGRSVSLGFTNSEIQQYYSFSYLNPYYTVNGVSRAFSVYYSHSKYRPDFNFQSYTQDGYGVNLGYGFPLSEHNTLSLGFGYEHVAISDVQRNQAAPSVVDFLNNRTGASYNILKITSGWSYNSLNRFVLPTKGVIESFGVELGVPAISSAAAYYKIGNNFNWYLPLFHGFLFKFVSTLGYGAGYGDNNRLPFFLNYYAGGISGGVPGYAPNSLGPQNVNDSNAALGGNLLTTAGIHLILPSFISKRLRTAITLDAGNVFQVPIFGADNAQNGIILNDKFSLDNMRASAGILITWYSPFGPINVSYAIPLNNRPGDQVENFQFAFGTSI